MDMNAVYEMSPIGIVDSPLTDLAAAPKQGDEGSPQAWLDIDPDYAPGLAGLIAGDDLLVLTWLHLARRDVLSVHPRGNPDDPRRGVFNTRSPDRPNPIVDLKSVRTGALTHERRGEPGAAKPSSG
jgi:tRNA-Thr(GGU) m(6)t(6)A37 methyltransferase TsaA